MMWAVPWAMVGRQEGTILIIGQKDREISFMEF